MGTNSKNFHEYFLGGSIFTADERVTLVLNKLSMNNAWNRPVLYEYVFGRLLQSNQSIRYKLWMMYVKAFIFVCFFVYQGAPRQHLNTHN
jgi:hypothetical protein